MLSVLTDPRITFSFSTNDYYDTEYSSVHGFSTTQIVAPKLLSGNFGEFSAHYIQIGNFFIEAMNIRATHDSFSSFDALYEETVKNTFKPDDIIFLTTGDPHSRAFYLRNFGVFYTGLTNPQNAINEEDYINRITITIESLSFVLDLFEEESFSTTVVPVGGDYFVAVNYFAPPSDSLLGVLTALESLSSPEYESLIYANIQKDGIRKGQELLAVHRTSLRAKLFDVINEMHNVTIEGITLPMLDAHLAYSSATDTRQEPQRFVVSANMYSTIQKARTLGLLNDQEITEHLGMPLHEYKSRILTVFGDQGYIKNSVHPEFTYNADPARNIVLDFAHQKNGFWNLDDPKEAYLYAHTAEIILRDPRFRNEDGRGFVMSITNPDVPFLHSISTPSYQGRTVWPHYNIEFAAGLEMLSENFGNETYRSEAESIVTYIVDSSLKYGGYPEVLNEKGTMYRTYIYKSAHANAWISRLNEMLPQNVN